MKEIILKNIAGFACLGLAMLVGGCGATKEPLSAEEWGKMEQVITSQNFVFVARFAEPIGDAVSQIDLTGRVNYMSLQGDLVKMELPYFGTRQVANMSGDRGLRFETTATDIQINKNEKQNHYDMNFKARDRSESFSCNLRVYSGLLAVLTVNSSNAVNRNETTGE